MAEGILFSAAQLVIDTLGSAAVKEIGRLWGVDDELNKLQRTLSTIKAVLVDAEKKKAHNNQLQDWLERLHSVVEEADILLDEVATEALRRQVMAPGNSKIMKEIRAFFSSSNQVAIQVKMGRKVRDIREKLDGIVADRAFLHLEESREEAKAAIRVRETHSFVAEDDVLGRVDDKVAVLKLLLSGHESDGVGHESDGVGQERVSVIPIVGMGGLGKTTLAQLVFNDEKVRECFALRIWVCVSDDFGERSLVGKILKTVSDETGVESLEMEQLQTKLRGKMSGQRYLLVLDDVWNEDHHKWGKIFELLRGCGEARSSIIVTTRSKKVAEVMGTLPPHCLGVLRPDDSWSLFKKKAFGNGELEPSNSTNVAMAEKIMKTLCGGVPLALSIIGRLLYFSEPENDWPSFLEKDLSDVVPQEENHIMNTLRLSYDYLPSHLKRCFVFCRLFPKDHEIGVQKLIRLWMAQGLITSSNHNQNDLEDIGHKFFMDLYCRSFFQEIEGDDINKVKTCKMHDLVHDLAVEVAGKKYAMLPSKEESISASVRHLSFHFDLLTEVPVSFTQAKGLRTILGSNTSKMYTKNECLRRGIYKAAVSNFKFLRFLDLQDCGIITLSSSISQLKLLRYLDLSGNLLETLPTSITKLVNLQTLKLNRNHDLRKLPRGVDKLVKLRHLVLWRCDSLSRFPSALSRLTNLRTLTQFVATYGHQSGNLDVLMRLDNLRGSLVIKGLRGRMVTEGANLKGKKYLHSLYLEWPDPVVELEWIQISANEWMQKDPFSEQEREKALNGLQPHPNLKVLSITRYDGATLSNWLSLLTNLVELDLRSCIKCHKLPALDKLHSLKKMVLIRLLALEYITSDDANALDSHSTKVASPPVPTLPSLQELTLMELDEFIGWEGSNMYFPCLTMLKILSCPKLVSLPSHPYVK